MTSLFFSFLMSASFLNLPTQSDTTIPPHYLPEWKPGMVVLESNDTVLCPLRYNQMVPEGLLQVVDGENVLTLSVRDVKCFFFYDSKRNRHRKFFTLSMPIENHPPREMFLEYVYGNDRLSILNHRTMGFANAYMEFAPIKQAAPINKQYLLDVSTGDLLPMTEENALSLVSQPDAVMDFINKNGIRFRKMSDFVKVFEYDRSL